MLQLMLAQNGVDESLTLKIAKIAIGLAIFVIAGLLVMSKSPNDDQAIEVYKSMPEDQLSKMRDGAPKQARTWIFIILGLGLYHIGRQVYQITIDPDVLLGRSLNIAMYALFLIVPAIISLVVIPKPGDATNERLTLCSKLMSAGALLMVVWGVLFLVTGTGHWAGAFWYLFIALPLFLCSTSISQIRIQRRYDEVMQT